ncbi:Tuberous sclerosis 2-like protein [Ptychographa xylographoides]|nr:Tuberous sclerosis 2-like protein [Ptychographa xylographoides]
MNQSEDGDEPIDHPESANSPSLQDRVRSLTLSFGSPSDTPPPSRHVRQRETEDKKRDHAVRLLDRNRSLHERKSGVDFVNGNIKYFSLDALAAIWTAADDLFQETASLEARDLGFSLINTSLVHPTIGLSERTKLFRMIVVPIEASAMDKPIQALRIITADGKHVEPFTRPLVGYLCVTLDPLYEATLEARRRLRGGSVQSGRMRLAEKKGLYALLGLIANVIHEHPDAIDGHELDVIIGNAVKILRKTSSEREMKEVLSVITAVILQSRIPDLHTRSCVEVLCAISVSIDGLKDTARQGLLNLLRSSKSVDAVDLLIGTMLSTSEGKETNYVSGATTMLIYLIHNNGADNLPKICFPQLYQALAIAPSTSRRSIRNSLRIISHLLEVSEFTDFLLQHDHWGPILTMICRAIDDKDIGLDQDPSPTLKSIFLSTPPDVPLEAANSTSLEMLEDVMEELRSLAGSIIPLWPYMDDQQKILTISFFNKIRTILPSEAEDLVVGFMITQGRIFPGSSEWDQHLLRLSNKFVLDPTSYEKTRYSVLHCLKKVPSTLKSSADKTRFRTLIFDLLERYKAKAESSLHVTNALCEVVVSLAIGMDLADYKRLLQALWSILTVPDLSTLLTVSDGYLEEAHEHTISVSIVRLFLQSLSTSAEKTNAVYTILVNIAKERDLTVCARLPAMRLLTRLRCDLSHAIFITLDADSLRLAATISRTEGSTGRSGVYQNQGDRASLHDEQPSTRIGRPSTMSQPGLVASRTSTQSATRQSTESRPTPPQWMYPGRPGLPDAPPSHPSKLVFQYTRGADELTTIRLSDWLVEVIDILQKADDWEIYSYVLVHLPSQLSNPTLFSNAVPHIKLLRNVIASQLRNGQFREPPANTGVKKGDVAFCLMNTLIMLLGYSEHFARAEQDDIVRTILAGMSSWDRVAKICIQGLSICCHGIPNSITRSLNAILQKMSQIITQSHLAMDILEFLAGLARLPNVYVNLREDELRTVFAICIRYLEHSRDQREKRQASSAESGYLSNRMSDVSGESGTPSESSHVIDVQKDLPQYVFALAYHVLTIWFLSLRLVDRPKHVGWITRNLASKDANGKDVLEEQSQVTLDMMHRTAYLDLGETVPSMDFSLADGKVFRKTWLLGLSIVTVETAAGSGLTHLIKRQASGTTYATYQQHTAPLPPHHVDAPTDLMSSIHGPESCLNILPNHVFLQLTSTIAPTPSPMEAICLPDDEATRRAISTFDRNDTVDGYKVGVIYVGHGQSHEAPILANSEGSYAFNRFLEGLGSKVELKDAIFNTQGLDKRADTDGKHTYAWRDRITEIVFHIPTMMPTDSQSDPHCINKKRHIGNDYVNIIFNESGLPFKFDTFPSQFNYVNIIITPEAPLPLASRVAADMQAHQEEKAPPVGEDLAENKFPEKQSYYTIQTLSHPSFPLISPAASYKLLPLTHLPGLARQIALNASVFSNVWANREGGEHVSSWRNRLRAIKQLRARFANTGTSASDKYPGAKGSKTYVEWDRFIGTVAMGGLAEDDGILSGLDFSRWAGPNPPLS